MKAEDLLLDSPGFKVLAGRLPVPFVVPELERMAGSLGALSFRDGGVAAWPVKPRKVEGTFSERIGEARFHTDSQYHERPERFFMLACERPAEDGGENFLLARDAVIEVAEAALGVEGLKRLRQPVWRWSVPEVFRQPGAPEVSPASEVLRPDGTLRWRIDNLMVASKYDQELANAFADALDASPRRVTVRLQAGEILLCDNWRTLHARAYFADPERLLYRIRLH